MLSRINMFSIFFIIFLALFLLIPNSAEAYSEINLNDSLNLNDYIKNWIHIKSHLNEFELNKAHLYSEKEITDFYDNRNYNPVWVNENGLLPRGRELLSLLSTSNSQGLNPRDYHLSTLINLWRNINEKPTESISRENLAQIELLLTDAFFIYTSDLISGRVDPESFDRIWIKNTSIELVDLLEETLEKDDINEINEKLNPKEDSFQKLYDLLEKYNSIKKEGGLIEVDEDITLEPGDKNENVSTLRDRLKQEPNQSIPLQSEEEDHFDSTLKTAIKNFQHRFGLNVTGTANKETLKTLNISVDKIIEKIKLNLERWRWLPRNFQDEYILVNIPDYNLKVIKNDQNIMEMRAIIGKEQRQTPVFSSRITHLVFSPRWYIPRSIAVEDYLPEVKNDVSYLEDRNIKVYTEEDNRFKRVDPEEIEWEEIDKSEFDYYFWQDPGPWNSLGRVIFKLPNSYDIYLHDSPQQNLFDEDIRSFSSGCIRLEDAIGFALYLLEDNPEWDQDKIDQTISDRDETTVFLSEPVPIHLLYWTVWVEDDNQLHYRNDIYNRDEKLKNIILK